MISTSKQTAIVEALAGLNRFPAGNATVASLAVEAVCEMYTTDEEVDRMIRKLYGNDGLDEWPGPKSWREWIKLAVYPHGMVKPNASSGWVINPKNGPQYNRRYKQNGQDYEYWQDGRFHEFGTPVRAPRSAEQDLMSADEFKATNPQFQALLKKTAMPSIERSKLAPRWTPDRSDESEAA